jgi:hypothetical protein
MKKSKKPETAEETSKRIGQEQSNLAVAVGYALSSWTGLENNLTLLFQTIAQMKEEQKALVVMASIVSFDARHKVVCELMDAWDWDGLDLKMWHTLANRIQRQQKRRNELAHFQLVSFGGAKPEDCHMALVPYFTQAKAYSGITKRLFAADIWERNERFRELAASVSWFTRSAKLSPRQRQASPEPDTGLIPELRKLASQNLEEDELPRRS